ncbi:crotonase/enoyl-CoA hydratase family protein [Novosphingobium sp.]|uniref:crotonase/enoyl-CoA hydratase family protein n=1 Tax=Novosphingobium sp. TaxID=1874826 RepID=UPI00286D45B5|nr:crotonase/enoyl-CoA hydratase family protein [Novosphingobium sp.]
MTDAPVLYSLDDQGIATITLNRADLRNPISDLDLIEALLATLAAMEDDANVRCAILTGAGSAFSAGGNLKAMMPDSGGLNASLPARTRRNYKSGIQRLPLAFTALEVPVIAAVNGPAIGAGLDLACMCDLRVASESAKFAESFVKLGIIPGDGGAWLLQRIVGFSKAAEMTLTGETIDAAEALRIGLVSKVVPDAELLSAAHAMAARIACNPSFAVRMAKRLIWDAQSMSIGQVLEMSAAMQSVAHATKDNAEAVNAFLEKRKPVFKGD